MKGDGFLLGMIKELIKKQPNIEHSLILDMGMGQSFYFFKEEDDIAEIVRQLQIKIKLIKSFDNGCYKLYYDDILIENYSFQDGYLPISNNFENLFFNKIYPMRKEMEVEI